VRSLQHVGFHRLIVVDLSQTTVEGTAISDADHVHHDVAPLTIITHAAHHPESAQDRRLQFVIRLHVRLFDLGVHVVEVVMSLQNNNAWQPREKRNKQPKPTVVFRKSPTNSIMHALSG